MPKIVFEGEKTDETNFDIIIGCGYGHWLVAYAHPRGNCNYSKA